MGALAIETLELSERDFRAISDLIYEHCGINLHDGKKELVRARLAKLIRQGQFATFDEYIAYVSQDSTGLAFCQLVDALSTNLTSFFRESQHFGYLQEQLLPALLERKQKASQYRIRAWSAGCSSGEEPYSIAITVLDAVQGKGRWDVKVLGTDLSTRMLDVAKRGAYDEERIRPVPPLLKQRYLSRCLGGLGRRFEVTPQVRQAVVLSYLNLMEDWPVKGPLDFIFCRNVMIYFDKPTQQRLVSRFFDLLESGGVLFTGHSESLTGITHRFRYVQPTIYSKP